LSLETTIRNQKGQQTFRTCEYFLKPSSNTQDLCIETIREKVEKEEYQNISEILQDFELMCEQAQLANRIGSYAYNDASYLRNEVRKVVGVLQNKSLDELLNVPVPETKHCRKRAGSLDSDLAIVKKLSVTPPESINPSPIPDMLVPLPPTRVSCVNTWCLFCEKSGAQRAREIMFSPCSHLLACHSCSLACDYCPKCGKKIETKSLVRCVK
jgi:hypothetical protein